MVLVRVARRNWPARTFLAALACGTDTWRSEARTIRCRGLRVWISSPGCIDDRDRIAGFGEADAHAADAFPTPHLRVHGTHRRMPDGEILSESACSSLGHFSDGQLFRDVWVAARAVRRQSACRTAGDALIQSVAGIVCVDSRH